MVFHGKVAFTLVRKSPLLAYQIRLPVAGGDIVVLVTSRVPAQHASSNACTCRVRPEHAATKVTGSAPSGT